MSTIQLTIFNQEPERRKLETFPDVEKFKAAVVCAAIGDALGWPTEFTGITSKPNFELPLNNFVSWKKVSGGRWQGFEDHIESGSYSDDTQLCLAVNRSINEAGKFQAEKFAYEELPLWLHYERGGGRAVKQASKNLLLKSSLWNRNFYQGYFNAGGNGAAMRSLPIALAGLGKSKETLKDAFLSAIVTHGHPRAIVGTIAYCLAVQHVIVNGISGALYEYLRNELPSVLDNLLESESIVSWIGSWNDVCKNETFKVLWKETIFEFLSYLKLSETLSCENEIFLGRIGALKKESKGSGTVTVAAALHLVLRNHDEPIQALFDSANGIGSDTDTIGTFVGGLIGSAFGTKVVPDSLLQVQDSSYLHSVGSRLHRIVLGSEAERRTSLSGAIDKRECLAKLMAWELGLHEMFWDALVPGDTIVHPCLGRGTIIMKTKRPVRRGDYVAKLVEVMFDSGQSCIFHSRVKDDYEVENSRWKALRAALY